MGRTLGVLLEDGLSVRGRVGRRGWWKNEPPGNRSGWRGTAPRFQAVVEPERRSSFLRDRLPRRVAASQVASCEEFYSAIETQSGVPLVAAIRRADPYCIDELQWLGDRPGLQAATSSERHVTDVANAIPKIMGSYGSDRVKDEISNLFLYLEMAGDIHHWCRTEKQCDGAVWETALPYPIDAGSVAGGALRSAFDSFVGHADFLSNEDEHGEVRVHCGQNDRHVPDGGVVPPCADGVAQGLGRPRLRAVPRSP